MLNIGYEAKRVFHNYTGLGNYSRQLLYALGRYHPENRYYLYASRPDRNNRTQFLWDNEKFKVRSTNRYFKSFWRMRGMRKAIRADQINVFHGLSHEIPFFGEFRPKTVVTMHDLIYKHYPAHFGYIQSKIYDLKYKSSCIRADQIVAISQATKRDIIEYYRIPESKVKVIYQSCNEIFRGDEPTDNTQRMEALPGEFLLYVGSLTERKNLLNVVRALEFSDARNTPILIVVGRGGAYEKKVRNYVRRRNLEQRILFFGEANLKQLHYLYKHALLFIYPSLWEGFGIPIIEALNCKTPVVTSNISSMPEAAGPGAFYVTPTEPQEIATAIKKILGDSDYRLKLIQDGYQYVQRFDDRIISDQWSTLYKRLANKD